MSVFLSRGHRHDTFRPVRSVSSSRVGGMRTETRARLLKIDRDHDGAALAREWRQPRCPELAFDAGGSFTILVSLAREHGLDGASSCDAHPDVGSALRVTGVPAASGLDACGRERR